VNKKLEKQANETLAKIRILTRHIRNVCDNCSLLGEKLILAGEIDLGKQLIANGFLHDSSKFSGIEWENLTGVNVGDDKVSKLKLKLAINHHANTNQHHVDHWRHISLMPKIFLAELVCDLKARSEEFGTDLRQWINEIGIKKWGISQSDNKYKEIMSFVDLLCEKPFVEAK
jgi:hypothetical protein